MTDTVICQRCGELHEHCIAHNKRGGPCGRAPVEWQRVCDRHGGKSPQALQSAARRKASSVVTAIYEADPESELAAQGVEPIRDPLLELSKLAAEAVHWKEALGARVNALTELATTSQLGVEQVASEVALYERALDRTAKFLDLLVRSGFEERRLKLDEQTAQAFTQVLHAVLGRLALTPEQQAFVPGVVVEELRALDAGS